MDPEAQRVRAWVLFNVREPEDVAKKIALRFADGEDRWIIVRADVVRGDYNLVVPVDAADEAAYDEVLGILREAAPGAKLTFARVKDHVPPPPHKSDFFVTRQEWADDHPLKIEDRPGRHRSQSPGGNAWG